MRHTMHYLAAAALVTCTLSSSLAHAAWPTTPGIKGTPHDFSTTLWTTEICRPCHSAHGGNLDVQNDAPLWNHGLSSATYDPYTSATIKFVPGQPNGVSKLCLGCHDGTVGLDTYGGRVRTGVVIPPGSKLINPHNSHPISFTYDQSLATADPGVFDPTTKASGISATGTIQTDMLDYNGMVQCTSCHEPHNKYGINTYLKKSNSSLTGTASGLCLTCHNK